MTDAEKPTAGQDNAEDSRAAGNSDTADQLKPTQILGEDQIAETMPPLKDDSAKARSSSDTQSNVKHGRIEYFGDYELLDEIARGGMGVVYRARQSRLKRIVAVKMILGGKLASDNDVKRFLVEAGAAANLDHPGIVPVYEFGEYAGTHYFSMAFVDGPSLAAKAGENPLPPDEAANLIAKLADAVAYAHRHGVVHRDLKPANVLIEKDGHPRITDFGLAKRTDSDDELTQDGTIMGSVMYMAPEQAAGKTALIGTAADIYALGAILYKLLTGHPPFQAPTTLETLKQVIEQEPVPPRRVNSHISRDLETICLKCMQKDIVKRFESADELVDELKRYQQGQPILSRPISRWAYAWRWCRRNPLSAGLAAGLATVLVVGIVAATTLLNRAESQRRRFQQQQRNVNVLSNMVLSKTLEETDEWLKSFFEPVERELLLMRDWTRDGVIDAEQPDIVNRHLVPLLEHYPQISSMMIADDRGREHMLLCIENDESGISEWKCRQTRRDQWQDEAKWLQWNDDQRTNAKWRTENTDYDPRGRPWFQGALAKRPSSNNNLSARDLIHWTEPYVFFTTKDLGITAALTAPIPHNDTVKSVVAFDVLLEDITRFTIKKRPTQHGRLYVLTENARLVGLPNDSSSATPDQWKKLFLQPLSDSEQAFARAAHDAFSFAVPEGTQIRSFQSDASTWWGAAKPFQLGGDLTLWILVLLPESDLHASLTDE